MNKPVVYFSNHLGFTINVGSNARVYALNHPKLGTQRVITSTIIGVKEDDDVPGGVSEFETLNTRYVHLAMPDAEDNVEIAPSPNVLINAISVEDVN